MKMSRPLLALHIGFWLLIGAWFAFLMSCGHVSAQDATLIRVQSDCMDTNYWLSAEARVRMVYIDARTGSRISYIFECSNGLLVNPVEESRTVKP